MTNQPTQSNRRILIVDDNPAIHDDFRKIFAGGGTPTLAIDAVEAELFGQAIKAPAAVTFELDSAFQGHEGLAKVQAALAAGRPYAMAFVDVRMPPGWDGIETLARIWAVQPDLQAVICTAYSDYSFDEIVGKLERADQLVILKKPFDNIEALQLAHALTEKWRLLRAAQNRATELEQHVAARTAELQAANEKLQAEIGERARLEQAFRQSQKMEAIGQLAGGVAHDFNNILTVIRGYLCLVLADEKLEARIKDPLQQVDAAAQRAANLTRPLLTFSRKQLVQREALDLNEVITNILKMLHRLLGEDIALQVETAADLPRIHADRAMMEQVLVNLAVNARDAMLNGGRLLIETRRNEILSAPAAANPDARPGRFVCLTVADTGAGMASEVLAHLFEPFFTTKEVGKGTGLGLATVFGIVKQHEGWIEVASEPGQGACFKIYFPEHQLAQSPQPAARATPDRPMGGSETIFLVEDEPALRGVAAKVLRNYGYEVITATSGAEALKTWPAHAAKVDLLLTDMVMPDGVSGRELAQQLRAAKPALKVLFSSGYSTELVGRDALLHDGKNFLPKPYNPDKLARTVRKCLDNAAVALLGLHGES
jgi:two-component system, NtrC family, sensor kinase